MPERVSFAPMEPWLAVRAKQVALILLLFATTCPIALSAAWFGSAALGTQATNCSSDPTPADQDPRFFPAGTFADRGRFRAGAYACRLRNMREAPLPNYLSSAQPKAFRLMLAPPFRPTVVVRLDINLDGSGELAVKRGESGKNTVVAEVDRVEPVSKPDADRFIQLFDKANFWLMSTEEDTNNERRIPPPAVDHERRHALPMEVNGVVWVVEATEGNVYHAVTRTSPKPGPFSDMALFLLSNIAKIDLRTIFR